MEGGEFTLYHEADKIETMYSWTTLKQKGPASQTQTLWEVEINETQDKGVSEQVEKSIAKKGWRVLWYILAEF